MYNYFQTNFCKNISINILSFSFSLLYSTISVKWVISLCINSKTKKTKTEEKPIKEHVILDVLKFVSKEVVF